MKVKKLNEAPTLKDKTDAAAKDVAAAKAVSGSAKTPVVKDPDQIKRVLNRLLEVNIREKDMVDKGLSSGDWSNVIFTGTAGTGKSARIKAWAKEWGVNLVWVMCSSMDQTDVGGAIAPDETGTIVKRLATTEFDELGDNEYSVLFLDEFNRGSSEVRGTLLTLIQEHIVRDDRVTGKSRKLPNFLFTIIAVNPDNGIYNVGAMDDAEIGRARSETVVSDPKSSGEYLMAKYSAYADPEKAQKEAKEAAKKAATRIRDELINNPDFWAEGKKEAERKAKLMSVLAKSPKFKFDTDKDIDMSKEKGNGLILNARNLTNLLQYCDGTKDDFLDNFNSYCNSLKKKDFEEMLADYSDIDLSEFEDKDDKATKAIKGSEKMNGGPFAKNKQANMDKVRAKMGGN